MKPVPFNVIIKVNLFQFLFNFCMQYFRAGEFLPLCCTFIFGYVLWCALSQYGLSALISHTVWRWAAVQQTALRTLVGPHLIRVLTKLQERTL